MSRKQKKIIGLILFVLCILGTVFFSEYIEDDEIEVERDVTSFEISSIPEYESEIYVEINNNIPYFKEEEYTLEPFEKYSKLDNLNRCGVAYANICKEIMPKEERKDISKVKPSRMGTN